MDKSYIDIKKCEPDFNELVYIMMKDGCVYKARKVKNNLYTRGYCFVNAIYNITHAVEEVVAWKYYK